MPERRGERKGERKEETYSKFGSRVVQGQGKETTIADFPDAEEESIGCRGLIPNLDCSPTGSISNLLENVKKGFLCFLARKDNGLVPLAILSRPNLAVCDELENRLMVCHHTANINQWLLQGVHYRDLHYRLVRGERYVSHLRKLLPRHESTSRLAIIIVSFP